MWQRRIQFLHSRGCEEFWERFSLFCAAGTALSRALGSASLTPHSKQDSGGFISWTNHYLSSDFVPRFLHVGKGPSARRESQNPGVFWVGRNLHPFIHPFTHPIPSCHGQGHFPLSQLAPNPNFPPFNPINSIFFGPKPILCSAMATHPPTRAEGSSIRHPSSSQRNFQFSSRNASSRRAL